MNNSIIENDKKRYLSHEINKRKYTSLKYSNRKYKEYRKGLEKRDLLLTKE